MNLRESEASRPAALVKLWLTQPSVFRRVRVTSEGVLTCGSSLVFNIEAPAHRHVNPPICQILSTPKSGTSEQRTNLVPMRASTRLHSWKTWRDIVWRARVSPERSPNLSLFVQAEPNAVPRSTQY